MTSRCSVTWHHLVPTNHKS